MFNRISLILSLLLTVVLAGCNQKHVDNLATKSYPTLKILVIVTLLYADSHNNKYPDFTSPETLKRDLEPFIPTVQKKYAEFVQELSPGALPEDLKHVNCFVNPNNNKPYIPNSQLQELSVIDTNLPSKVVLFYESEPYDDGTRGIVFTDGRFAVIPNEDWVARSSNLMDPLQN